MAATLAIALVLATSGLLACTEPSGPSDTDTGGTSGTTAAPATTSSTSGTTASATTTPTTTPTTGASTGDPSAAAECEAAGGICIGRGGCIEGGGSLAATSPGGCAFAEQAAECCVPPAPKPEPKSCTDAGGLCAPIGGCLDAGGYFTSISEGCEFSGNLACCVPHDRCGEHTIECCSDGASFNPVCDDGAFACTAGSPVPKHTCVPPEDESA